MWEKFFFSIDENSLQSTVQTKTMDQLLMFTRRMVQYTGIYTISTYKKFGGI